MGLSVKELLVVLMIAGAYFWLAKPVALRFTPAADFARRRSAWFALTVLVFLSPNFWVYAAVAIPILVVTGRRDSNPAAVYLMLLQVTPPIGQSIPLLFMLDSFLLLSFCVLTPAAVRIMGMQNRPRYRGLTFIDLTLLGYGVFSSFHYLQAQSIGGVLYPITLPSSIKRLFVFGIETYVPYFVISRSNANRRSLVDSIASYCFSCGLLASIACFENLKSWLLYSEVQARLGDAARFEYLTREHALRAMASTGHPLTLATLLSIAVVLWLYVHPKIEIRRARLGTALLLTAGLYVTYSRGPWTGAAIGCLMFVLLRPGGASRVWKTAVGISVAAAALSFTPVGEKVISLMPMFGGTSDTGTLLYREDLFNRSLAIIALHPLIGDTRALLHMASLRQGQGIIDLVNFYIQILLSGGAVGLALLLGFLLIGVAKANSARRRLLHSDPDLAALGASLFGCIAGFLVTLAGGSFGNGTERMYYVLGGFLAAYVAIATAPSERRGVAPISSSEHAPVLG